MADTNITPPEGTLTATGKVALAITVGLVLMGYSPTLGLQISPSAGQLVLGEPIGHTTIQTQTGSLTAQGYAPTPSELALETKLRFTGYAPNVGGQNTNLTPPVGTLVLGITVDNSVAKTPPAGTLTFTAAVADVINPVAPKPTVGTADLTGYAPIVSTVPSSTVGVLTLTGYAPLINRGIIPGTATLKCSPVATIGWTANTEPDLAGYKVYRGLASRTYTTSVTVGTSTLSYSWTDLPDGTNYFAVTAFDTSSNESGFSDEVSTVISGRGYAPTLTVGTGSGIQIDTAVGALSLTGQIPVVSQGISPPAGTLILTGELSALVIPTEQLILTGIAPSVTHGGPLNVTLTPTPGSLIFTGNANRQIAEPLFGILTLQGYAGTATIQVLGSPVVIPDAGSLVFFAPTPFNPNLAQHANSVWAPGGTPDHA